MNNLAIKRIFDSFRELEAALSTAKTTLEQGGHTSSDLLQRVSTYENILDKQRDLATALCGYATLGQWDEVTRHIKIINGLSAMIRDDAREIISIMHQTVENPNYLPAVI